MTSLISTLAIAPMIDWSYSHFRVFMRLLAPQALLYTEMQTTGAILHNPQHSLDFSAFEHPLALQIGGSDPQELVRAAVLGEQRGYDEINLNLGCPSDKVQAGRFGACMMKEPEQVKLCIQALRKALSIPLSAKIRIGVDEQDSYAFFSAFAHQLVEAGCDKIIVHARKAWLKGLSPKQNRTIPPLHYDYVYRLKQQLDVPVVINGNILNIEEIQQHLKQVDGVMLGRLACDNPYRIALIAQALSPQTPLLSREALLKRYQVYLLKEYAKGCSLSLLLKPIFNIFHGLAGARQWKKQLNLVLQTKDLDLLQHLDRGLLSESVAE